MSKTAFYQKFITAQSSIHANTVLPAVLAAIPTYQFTDLHKAYYETALKKIPKLHKKPVTEAEEFDLAQAAVVIQDDDLVPLTEVESFQDLAVSAEEVVDEQQYTLVNDKTASNDFAVPGWWLPLAALAGGALAGNSDGATASAPNSNSCNHEPLSSFSLPAKPSATGALQINLARGVTLLQSSEDALDNHYDSGDTSLIITLAEHSNLDGEDGDYVINASGNMGDIYLSAGVNARSQIKVNASESVGDVIMTMGAETSSSVNNLEIDAYGDVRNLFMLTSGVEAAGTLNVQAFGGDIGNIDFLSENMSGGGYLYASAYNDGSGVGGNIGNINFTITGAEASGRMDILANGGDIGDINFSSLGGSASGGLNLYAFEQSGYGGDIGDISILAVGASADPSMSVSASHNVGNISMSLSGFDAQSRFNLDIFNGGTVGNIDIQVGGVSCSPLEANEASGYVNISGNNVHIGNVTMAINDGQRHEAGFSAGNDYYSLSRVSSVGDISITATAGSYSGNTNTNVVTDTSDIVSSVGNIILDDQGFNGDHEINIWANQISGLSAFIGHGSANVRISLLTGDGSGASVGDVFVTMGDQHFGSGGHIITQYDLDAEVGTITIDGGSEFSRFAVMAGGSFTNQVATYNSDALAIGDIDMSQFNGFSNISLGTVQNGVRIDVGQSGSRVRGTYGGDEIYLGAGQDIIFFDHFNSGDAFDHLYDVDLSDDGFHVPIYTDSFWDSETDIGPVSANALLSLVDKTGGQDLSDADDLAIALMAGGEYEGLLDNATSYTIATASTYDANSFNLYQVWFNNDTAYVHLMAEFSLSTGSMFSDLSLSNVANVV